VGLVVTVPRTIDALVAQGEMSERLADRLGDRAVALPALSARGEDLRALALEHLSRIGTRLRGRPFGLDLRALSAILEYPWPGNDAELGAVLLRAALAAEGDVLGLRELTAIGFPTGGGARGGRAEPPSSKSPRPERSPTEEAPAGRRRRAARG
jgi:DNA-binding NtrC family response regulator